VRHNDDELTDFLTRVFPSSMLNHLICHKSLRCWNISQMCVLVQWS